ncbi:MAG: GIY-YIG nuclease family protein [Bacteroidia bacterium]
MNIYLINQVETNYYKIGITKKNPEIRLSELTIGNPQPLKLIVAFTTEHGYKLESALHAHYRLKRVNSEWFELSDEEVSLFIDECSKKEKIISFLKESGNPFI